MVTGPATKAADVALLELEEAKDGRKLEKLLDTVLDEELASKLEEEDATAALLLDVASCA